MAALVSLVATSLDFALVPEPRTEPNRVHWDVMGRVGRHLLWKWKMRDKTSHSHWRTARASLILIAEAGGPLAASAAG